MGGGRGGGDFRVYIFWVRLGGQNVERLGGVGTGEGGGNRTKHVKAIFLYTACGL